ncbi:MAG: hypothetical protein QNK03_06055, partial [Myxococcota bacterium]|nr:hypothetical protein [Myxococcota bacterium]
MSRWRSLLALGIGLTACTAAAQERYRVDWEEVCAGGTTVLPIGVQVSVSGGACEFPTGPNFYVGQVIVISFSLDPGYGNPEEFLGVSNAGANFGRAYPNPCCPPPFPGASHCCEHTWVMTDDQGRMHWSSWSSLPALGPAPFDGIHRITIDGRPGYISMGDIVFELTTECSVGTGDTDGDGLPDVWEECGLNVGEDGEPETCLVRPCDLSLRDMGADPEHKDLFVEIDWMDAGPHARGHWPRRIGMDRIRESFAKAGINLHLDTGQSSVMDPQTGRRWRSLSRSNSVNHVNKLGNCTNDPEDPVCNPTIWSDFDAIKGANFEKLREPVFRYGLIAHHIDDLGTSGLVRDIPGSDFIVSLGDWHPSGGG